MKQQIESKKRIILIFLVVAMFFVVSFSFPKNSVRAEDSLEEKEDEISSVEKKLKKEQDAKAKLEAELANIQSSVYSTQEQINKARALIKESEENISRMEGEVSQMDKKIDFQKEILKSLMREIYAQKSESILSFTIIKADFSKIFGKTDSVLTIQDKLTQISQEIKESKEKIEAEKEEIADAKVDHEELLANKVVQQYALLADKNETQGDIQEKEATIGELQQKMNELKSDLNRILGKSYDTGEIKDAIKFANKVTGVRKGFIFGMLSMESGGNPLAGKCTLKNADMTNAREDYFEKICDDLDYSDKKCKSMPLSCASKSYPGSGGAMGAAQFMSDTWWGYRDRIASVTGHNPPNPWSLLDGVTAMALKLENDGAAEDGKVSIKNPCNGKSTKVDWEIYASMRYLGWTCWGYTNYAPAIQALAKGYDKL